MIRLRFFVDSPEISGFNLLFTTLKVDATELLYIQTYIRTKTTDTPLPL